MFYRNPQQIAELMLARIESGDLALEDIPKRLARFGLMNPADFLACVLPVI